MHYSQTDHEIKPRAVGKMQIQRLPSIVFDKERTKRSRIVKPCNRRVSLEGDVADDTFLVLCLTKKQQKGAGLPNLPIVVFHWNETLLMILSSCFRASYHHDFSLLILSFLCVCVIWGFVENRRLIAYSQTRHEIHQQSDRCKAR